MDTRKFWLVALGGYFIISIKFWSITDEIQKSQAHNSDSTTLKQKISSEAHENCEGIYKRSILFNTSFDGNYTKVKKQIDTPSNGCWQPKNCKSSQRVAVIVAYRDREHHLTTFLEYIHGFLQIQMRDYCVIISEQADKGPFNRGKLFNIGYETALRHKFWKQRGVSPECFIFHDVDLLPENLKNWYGCDFTSSTHLCDKINKFDYRKVG